MNAYTPTTIPTPRQALAAMPYWGEAPLEEVLDLLEADSTVLQHGPGVTFVRQGEDAEYLYYVIEGEVREVRLRQTANSAQAPTIDRLLGPGRLIGSLALLYNLAYTGTATVNSPDTLLLRISTVAVDRLLYRYPVLRSRLVPQAIINRLRTMPLLAGVQLVTLGYLAEEVQKQEVDTGKHVYLHNTPPDKVYLIHKGQVELMHPRRAGERLLLGTGGAFGFPGSIGSNGGAPSIGYGHWARVTCPTELFSLPWAVLERMAQRYPHVIKPTIQEIPRHILKEISVFNNFSPEERTEIAGYCSFQHIPQHHLIVQQGDLADSMWILLPEGRAVLSALDATGNALPQAPVEGIVYFGEVALVASRNASSTVEAEPGGLWLRLHWQDFQNFLDAHPGEDLASKLDIRLPEELHRPQRGHQRYPWLGQGELLVSLTRRHWVALLQKARWGGIFLLLTGLAALGLFLAGLSPWWAVGIGGIPTVLILVWGVLDYLNDYFIVTNQRIIQQEKVIFISEQRREALLEQLQRIDIQTSFFGNLLGYGTVSVFTAGTTGSIDFDLVNKPGQLRAVIFRERTLRLMRYMAESKIEVRNELEKRLGLVVDMPGRVRTSEPERVQDIASLPWYQRLWRYLFVDSQLQWESAERIVWHKHWFILARQVVPLLLVFIALLLGMVIGLVVGGGQPVESVPFQALAGLELVLGAIALIVFGVMAWITADWWNDTYELTNDRIIDIEKLPLFFGEERREAQLNEIQDIRLQISTPLEMILDYGNVIVQTAASEGAFTFDHVPNPRAVKEEINRRLIEWRRRDERRKVRERLRELPDWFELYNRLAAGQQSSRPDLDDAPPASPGALG